MKIVLKDNTEIQGASVGQLIGTRMIELVMPKADALANLSKFMDPTVMDEITAYFGAWKNVYTGYNYMDHMDNPKADEMRIWMEGSEDAAISEQMPIYADMYMPKGV